MDNLHDNLNPDESQIKGMYPRVVARQTVFFDELIENATRNTGLTKIEGKMAVEMFLEQIKTELKNGNNVCIDDFGMFSLTAKSRLVKEAGDIRKSSIHVNRLVFRMSKAFMKTLGHIDFIRMPPTKYEKRSKK
jgi:predicted histone-like DNA-binding protein